MGTITQDGPCDASPLSGTSPSASASVDAMATRPLARPTSATRKHDNVSGSEAALDAALDGRRVRILEMSFESLAQQVRHLVSTIEAVAVSVADGQDKTQKLQNGVASLQKRVSVLEHLCTGSLEDLHIRCYSLEETQTLLAKAVASGSIAGGSVTEFVTHSMQDVEEKHVVENQRTRKIIDELSAALQTERDERQKEIAELKRELQQGRCSTPAWPTRLSTSQCMSPISPRVLQSHLLDIDSTIKAMQHPRRCGAISPPIGRRSTADGTILNPVNSGNAGVQVLVSPPSRRSIDAPAGPRSPSPPPVVQQDLSQASASCTRLPSPDRSLCRGRELGSPPLANAGSIGDTSVQVPAPWSAFVPFAQNKLTEGPPQGSTVTTAGGGGAAVGIVTGAPAGSAVRMLSPSCSQPVLRPQPLSISQALQAGVSPRQTSATVGCVSSSARPTSASIRPLQDQRITQAR